MAGDDASYSAWQKWDRQPFGALSSLDRTYFAAEVNALQLPPSASVLEIGFGHGAFLAFARSRGWRAAGIEINTVELELARDAGYAVYPDLAAVPPGDKFDLVAAFDVFEHLEFPDLIELLTSLRHRLAAGGVILARFPNGDSPFGLSNQNGDATHKTILTRTKINQAAAKAGLRLNYYRGEKTPVLCGHPKFMLQRLAALPVKAAADLLVNLIFLPTKRVPFSAQNAVARLSAADSTA